jgi:predicted RecA/RadA family phage recombinase
MIDPTVLAWALAQPGGPRAIPNPPSWENPPMRNYVQPGDSLAMAVPYATGVVAGEGVLVGALFGVAAVDGAQGAVIECQTKGVFDLAKQPALAITVGTRLFWDDTNRRLTTATGNFQVGIATEAAGASDATVRAVLLRVPASGA